MLLGRQALEYTPHIHPGSSRPLYPRGGRHVISQALPRGLEYSNSCISFFLSLLHSLLPLHSSSHTRTFFINSPRIFLLCALLKLCFLSLNTPFLSFWAILESGLGEIREGKFLLSASISIRGNPSGASCHRAPNNPEAPAT